MGRFLQEKLKLTLHPDKVCIKTLTSGVDVLRWVHFPDHCVLRTVTKRRMLRRASSADEVAIESYRGLLKHGNTYKLQSVLGLKQGLRRERAHDKVFPMQAVQTEKDTNSRDDVGGVENNVVYEIGFHILPIVPEGDVETVIGRLRKMVEKAGGSFIAEGAPQRMSLAYPMAVWNNGKWTKYSESHFGWLKFEVSAENIAGIESACKADKDILRYLIVTTIREDTRASVRQLVLKEVKRTDTIKSGMRAKPVLETKEEVSDEKLDEAIEEMVAD